MLYARDIICPQFFSYSPLPGFGSGAFCLASPLYIVDIAEADLRGSLTSVFQVMVTVGIATVEFLNIGDAVHWNIISGICMGVPGKY